MTRVLPLAALLAAGLASPAAAQSYRTTVETRRVEAGRPLRVDVAFGVGELLVHPGEGSRTYRVALTYAEDTFTPEVRFDQGAGLTALREKKGLSGANTPLEAKIKSINVTAADVAAKSGVTEKQLAAYVDILTAAATFSMVIGKEIVQSTGGSYKLLLLAAITYLANGRVYLLSEKANEQGALDMGCAPDMLPGYRPVAYPESTKRYGAVWHAELSDKPGLHLFDMIEAAEKGTLRAMYVMGEHPVCNIPNSGRV